MQVSFKSLENHTFPVTVSIPDAEEICPITLEPMSTYNLECAPHFTFDENNPLIRKMTLPCSHSFSALACLYHFCKTTMICPLCRKGCDAPLHVTSIPLHIRHPLALIIQDKGLQDRLEQDREDLESTLQLLQEDVQTNFPHFMSQHKVVLVTYCYETEDPVCPLISFEFELKGDLTPSNDSIQFSLPRWATRQWSSQVNQCSPVAMVQFAMGLRNMENDFFFLDRSCNLLMDDLDGKICIFGRGDPYFNIEVLPNSPLGLTVFNWNIKVDRFTNMFMTRFRSEY